MSGKCMKSGFKIEPGEMARRSERWALLGSRREAREPDAASGPRSIDLLPLRFRYGGASSDELLPSWDWEEKRMANGCFARRVLTAVNPEDGFGVAFTLDEHDTLPVSVWRVQFFNGGGLIISQVLPANETASFSDLGSFWLMVSSGLNYFAMLSVWDHFYGAKRNSQNCEFEQEEVEK